MVRKQSAPLGSSKRGRDFFAAEPGKQGPMQRPSVFSRRKHPGRPDNEGNIILWESSTGKVRTLIKQEDKRRIMSLAFSPDGKTLAAGMAERPGHDHDPGLIVLWDPATGKERLTLTGHTNGVASIAFRPDGKLLASGGFDRTVRLWDMTTKATKAR